MRKRRNEESSDLVIERLLIDREVITSEHHRIIAFIAYLPKADGPLTRDRPDRPSRPVILA
ncbi:MAG: hypothetical protein C4294_13925 [Nitrospiraceae bacterium]